MGKGAGMNTESERKRLKFLLLGKADCLENDLSHEHFIFECEVTPAEQLKVREATAYAIRYFVADVLAEDGG
jgi:hypothetical protein